MIAPLDAIGCLWLVWLAGWMLASFTAARSVVRQSLPGRLTHGLLVVAGAILIMGRNPLVAPLLRPVYPRAAWIGWTIYSGLLLALLGTAITRDTQAAFLGLPLLFAGLFVKSKQEERLLLDRFGPEYEKYRAEVPALIPRP
jgi:hypothetical protein